MQHLDTTGEVATPERVVFRYRLAGPGPRALAWLLDALVRAVMMMVFVLLASVLFPVVGDVGLGMFLVLGFVLEWLYGVILETLMRGQTPGKWAMGLRVVRVDGSPGQMPDFVLRNLLRGVDFLPGFYGIGVAVMWMDPRLRRLGDLVAGTVVVREDRSRMLAAVAIDPPVTEQERQSMPAKVMLDRDELDIIERFLRRRASLSQERAEELATLFGPALGERTGIEADSWVRVLTLAYARATGRDRDVQ